MWLQERLLLVLIVLAGANHCPSCIPGASSPRAHAVVRLRFLNVSAPRLSAAMDDDDFADDPERDRLLVRFVIFEALETGHCDCTVSSVVPLELRTLVERAFPPHQRERCPLSSPPLDSTTPFWAVVRCSWNAFLEHPCVPLQPALASTNLTAWVHQWRHVLPDPTLLEHAGDALLSF